MNPKKIICVTPVYNDWKSFEMLVRNIEKLLSDRNINQSINQCNYQLSVVAVNDGSIEFVDLDKINSNLNIEIVNLKINVGHQRAIAIGIQYVFSEKTDYDYVVVLDSDGEDKPEDIFRLVEKCNSLNDNKIIFAQRQKRQESLWFKTGYFFYKHIFKYFTGQHISFGNFSCIPKKLLNRIAYQESLWNHYSGSVIYSKTPYDKLLSDRGKRYEGKSKMNFNSLVLHGLSSFSVYFDQLSVRVLRFSIIGGIICALAILIVFYMRLFTDSSVPGWASSLILIISIIILQLFSLTLMVLLMNLSSRKNIKSPSSDTYKDFIDNIDINS